MSEEFNNLPVDDPTSSSSTAALFEAEENALRLKKDFSKKDERHPWSLAYARSTGLEAQYSLYLQQASLRFATFRCAALACLSILILIVVTLERTATPLGVACVVVGCLLGLLHYPAISMSRTSLSPTVETFTMVPVCALIFIGLNTMNHTCLNAHPFVIFSAMCPYFFFSCRRTGWITSGFAMTLCTATSVATLCYSSDIYFFSVLMFPTIVGALVGAARFWEQDQRSFYKNLMLSRVMLKAAENELLLQRAVLRMCVPDCVINPVADKCLQQTGAKAIAHQLEEIAVAAVRAPKADISAPNAKMLLKIVEARFRLLEQLVSSQPHLELINSLGDDILIGGPLHNPVRTTRASQPATDGAENNETQVDRFGMKIRDGPDDDEVALREAAWAVLYLADSLQRTSIEHITSCPQRSASIVCGMSKDGEVAEAQPFPGEDATCGCPLVARKGRWTVMLTAGSAFACVIGRQRPSFDLLGVGTRTASALIQSAPEGCVAVSSHLRELLFHEPPPKVWDHVENFDPRRLGKPQRWRCMSAGVLYVSILYPPTTHERGGHPVVLPR